MKEYCSLECYADASYAFEMCVTQHFRLAFFDMGVIHEIKFEMNKPTATQLLS